MSSCCVCFWGGEEIQGFKRRKKKKKEEKVRKSGGWEWGWDGEGARGKAEQTRDFGVLGTDSRELGGGSGLWGRREEGEGEQAMDSRVLGTDSRE